MSSNTTEYGYGGFAMNKKISKQILVAIMLTSISAAAGAADTTEHFDATDVVKHAASAELSDSRKSDVPPELREKLSQQIHADMAKRAEKAAQKKEADPVIVVGRVPRNEAVQLTLPRTVGMALDYNRDIKMAHYDLKSAEYAINEARAGKMPNINYSFAATRSSSQTGVAGVSTIGNRFTNGLSVSIPLYTGGKVEGMTEIAKLGKTTAQEEVLRVEQQTKLDAIKGYYALLAYKQLKDVYDTSVTNLEGHVRNVTAQYNVGTVAKLDVLTSDVSLANSKTDAVTAANNVANAEASLDNILGLPINTRLELADHSLPFNEYNMSLEDALDYAMKYRPEVLQAALAVEKADENIGVAQSGYRPTVAVGAGRNWFDTDFPGTKNKGWQLQGTVSLPIWDGGATRAKTKEAKEAFTKARENEQKIREAVQLEVKQAYLAIRSAAQRVQATQTVVNQATESFKIATVRYQAGVGINLDVLDAQLNLDKARTNNIQALYDYNVGIATLEKAMGMDVRTGAVIPTNA